MSDNIFLNLSALALSIFNTITLLWLGLTVLFNSDRRSWGIWLASGGLLLGAAFFVSHTIILQRGLAYSQWRFAFWWAVGFTPAHLLPYAWYVVMLWYAGYWNSDDSPLYRRQRPLFWLMTLTMFGGLAALVISPSLLLPPDAFFVFYDPTTFRGLREVIPFNNILIPILGSGYSIYMILCIAFSLDAVYRPGPSTRSMGDLARERARPWLFAASSSLLLVSLIVSYMLYWIWSSTREQRFFYLFWETVNFIARIDLLVLGLLTAVIVLLGQAAVSYELFTGKVLPRRGLQSHWRSALLAGSVFSLLISGTIVFNLSAVYGMLLITIFATCFAAFLGWRSYKDRELMINSLRPFVNSERLYDNLITQSNLPSDTDITRPFRAVCQDVLGCSVAYLAAVGSLTPLTSGPLTYPPHRPMPPFQDLIAEFKSPEVGSLPINPQQYHNASWAVSLWSQRGLIGIFLLGNKVDGSLYTQEEMEIARASGERLIDTQASAEIARRLMILQRQQMTQSQIIDQQTRRILHDDVLPQLHTAMLSLNGASSQEAVQLLTDAHKNISNLLREMPHTAAPAVAKLGLISAIRAVVEEEMGRTFDHVTWHIPPLIEQKATRIPTLTAEVVFYAAREVIRNAAKHGRIANRPLKLSISATWHNGLELLIEDNGPGLNGTLQTDKTSPSETSGGHGLALHSTMLAVVGGHLSTESIPNQYTRITLSLPEN